MAGRTIPILAACLLALVVACTLSGGPSTPPSGSVPPAGAIDVSGLAHAGPTCPVAKPNDPACADRAVDSAVLVVTTVAGTEVARTISAADGTFHVALPPGSYLLVARPVNGLMGAPAPLPFSVPGDGSPPAPLDVGYDTGIR